MATRSPLTNVMTGAAYKVARKLVRDFNEVEHLQVSVKGPRDFVTTADITADKMLREILSRARPEYGFLTEEGEPVAGRRGRWIVDPLDGTLNFLHGLPQFSISIAVEEQGKIIAGIVYDPIRDEMFWAEQGRGAYLNDRRLRVSVRRNMKDALIGVGGPLHQDGVMDRYRETLPRLIEECASYRRMGSAALDLSYIAAGRFDGYWAVGLSPWDIAAGVILVREAGGFVTEENGRSIRLDSPTVVAANDPLHDPLIRLVKTAKPAKG